MNIQTEHNELHQALITVELDAAQLEQKKQQAAKRLARNTRIPGFRPGKAPYHMILRHLGEGAILEEAIEKWIDEIYPIVLNESGVKPYGPGRLESLALDKTPPSVQFIIPLAPEVKLGDYQTLRLPYELSPITDETVEKAVESMREMYAEVAKVERPAEETDLVNITLTARYTDPAEEKPYIDHEAYPVVIEAETAETENEWPFPGFSRHLIGLSAEDKKAITYTYPEDYEDEETEEDTVSLKGKTLEFEIEITKVSSRSVPELNEDFIKKMGAYETVEEYFADMRKNLTERNEDEYNENFDEKLLQELINDAEIKYPQEAIEDEVDLIFNRLKNRLENQGIGFEIYLKARNITEEALRDELRPNAEKRLKETLVLMEIASQADIKVNADEVQHEIEHALGHLLSGMTEKEAQRTFNEDALRGLTANVYNNNLLGNTIKHLRAIARGEVNQQPEPSSENNTPSEATSTSDTELVAAAASDMPEAKIEPSVTDDPSLPEMAVETGSPSETSE